MVTQPLRDSRLTDIPWLGTDGLATLRSHRIAVLGVGNIGGEAARHLAMLSVPLLLVDRGVVEPANLGTQGFYDDDLGLPKVMARRRALQRLNPTCPIEILHLDIETMGFAALRCADLWLCCLDSLRLRLHINEMALRLGLPWIDAAIDGTGQPFARVAHYDPRIDSACFLCGYGPADVQELLQQGQPMPCQATTDVRPDAPPTRAVSATGAVAAGLQVLYAMEHYLKQPHQPGQEFLLNMGNREARSLRRRRDPHCVAGHEQWPLTEGLHQSHSLDEAFALAESRLGAPVTLTFHHHTLVTELVCAQCRAIHHPYRILDTLVREPDHCVCGGAYTIIGTGLVDRLTRAEASNYLDRSLQQLGFPADDVVIAQATTGFAYLLIAGDLTSPSVLTPPQQYKREAPHGSRI